MQTLNQNIRDHTFKSVYLLFGEGVFLKESYKSRLKEALTDGGTMNYNYFESKGVNVNKIIGLTDIVPFFAEKRLILVKDNRFFKDGVRADELTEYMGRIPRSTCLVFVESEMDKKSRLYEAVKKYDYTTGLSHQKPVRLVRWAAGTLSGDDRKIINHIMEFFLSKTRDDMKNISSELEKLISYTLGHEVITNKDVETICTTQITNKIFGMITAVAVRQTRKAMDLYEDPLILKGPPMHILSLIARQLNQILQVGDLMGKGMDKSAIASRLRLQPSVVGKTMLQAKTFIREQILFYMNLCVDAEEGVKTEKLQDRLTVELLIANKCE